MLSEIIKAIGEKETWDNYNKILKNHEVKDKYIFVWISTFIR